MKFYSTHRRLGTITLFPIKTQLDREGNPHRIPGLRLRLKPAWTPGFFTDEKGELVQEITDPGPEIIDTGNVGPQNEMALIAYWGEGWEEQLVAWLKDKAGGGRHGFVQGDPLPSRKIKVTLTQAEYDEVREGKKALPKPPEFTAGPPAQKVVKGPKSTGGGKA